MDLPGSREYVKVALVLTPATMSRSRDLDAWPLKLGDAEDPYQGLGKCVSPIQGTWLHLLEQPALFGYPRVHTGI